MSGVIQVDEQQLFECMHDKMLGGAPFIGSAQRSSGVLRHVCDVSKFSIVRGIEHAQGKIVPVDLHREIVPGKGY